MSVKVLNLLAVIVGSLDGEEMRAVVEDKLM